MSYDKRIADATKHIYPYLLCDSETSAIIQGLLDVIDEKDKEIAVLDSEITALESDYELSDLKGSIKDIISEYEDGDIDVDQLIMKLKWEI